MTSCLRCSVWSQTAMVHHQPCTWSLQRWASFWLSCCVPQQSFEGSRETENYANVICGSGLGRKKSWLLPKSFVFSSFLPSPPFSSPPLFSPLLSFPPLLYPILSLLFSLPSPSLPPSSTLSFSLFSILGINQESLTTSPVLPWFLKMYILEPRRWWNIHKVSAFRRLGQ